MKKTLAVIALLFASTQVCAATATPSLRFCVYDPAGPLGPAANSLKDLMLAAKAWGVNGELKAYPLQAEMLKDYKEKACALALMDGLQARQYNRFAGTVVSVGSIPTYADLRQVLQTLAAPAAAPLLSEGEHEIVGIIPFGAAWLNVNDSSMNSIAGIKGKRAAVLSWDKSQHEFVQALGAVPVASDINDAFVKFNTGKVDMIAAPAVAFKPLEMKKGLGAKGGIIRVPLAMVVADMVIWKDRFPADFGQRMRAEVIGNLDVMMDTIRLQEEEIPKRYWIALNQDKQQELLGTLQKIRVQLKDQGYYDPRMLTLLKRIRCKREAAEECSQSGE